MSNDTLFQTPMTPSNFSQRLGAYIAKRKAMKNNPVIPATRMPGDMAKLFQEARKQAQKGST